MTIQGPRISMRFGLRTLGAAVAFTAITVFAANWTYRSSVWRAALAAYEQTNAAWNTDSAKPSAVCAASEALANAAIKLPFADAAAARQAHLDRIVEIRARYQPPLVVTTDFCGTSWVNELSLIDRYLDRAQRSIR